VEEKLHDHRHLSYERLGYHNVCPDSLLGHAIETKDEDTIRKITSGAQRQEADASVVEGWASSDFESGPGQGGTYRSDV
jgi:hypothetical protein